jgi:hypothetical protein
MNLSVQPPALSDAEWDLLLELLERQQRELLVEIRHSDSGAFKQQLRLRLEMVNSLIDRLRPSEAA